MRRKITMAGVVAAAILILGACGNGSGSQKPDSQTGEDTVSGAASLGESFFFDLSGIEKPIQQPDEPFSLGDEEPSYDPVAGEMVSTVPGGISRFSMATSGILTSWFPLEKWRADWRSLQAGKTIF